MKKSKFLMIFHSFSWNSSKMIPLLGAQHPKEGHFLQHISHTNEVLFANDGSIEKSNNYLQQNQH